MSEATANRRPATGNRRRPNAPWEIVIELPDGSQVLRGGQAASRVMFVILTRRRGYEAHNRGPWNAWRVEGVRTDPSDADSAARSIERRGNQESHWNPTGEINTQAQVIPIGGDPPQEAS